MHGTLKNCCHCGTDYSGGADDRVCASCRKPRTHQKLPSKGLTFRQNQIVDLVIEAKLNKEIAFELHLTEGTVKEYMNRIFHKLGVRSRVELAVWGCRRSLVVAEEVTPVL